MRLLEPFLALDRIQMEPSCGGDEHRRRRKCLLYKNPKLKLVKQPSIEFDAKTEFYFECRHPSRAQMNETHKYLVFSIEKIICSAQLVFTR